MGSRDSTGLMVAVILLVFLTVALAIGTYMGYSSSAEAQDKMQQAIDDKKDGDAYTDVLEERINILRAMVGFDGNPPSEMQNYRDKTNAILANPELSSKTNFSTAKKEIDQDDEAFEEIKKRSASYASAEEADKITLRALIDELVLGIDGKHRSYTNEKQRVANAEQEKKDELKQAQNKLDAAVAAAKKHKDDLDTETQRHKQQEAELQKKLTEAENKNRTLNDEKGTLSQTLTSERNHFAKVISDKDKIFKELKDEFDKVTRKTFTIPDGQIVNVTPGARYAHINVGRADGLRTTQTFEVFDKSTTNFEAEKGKGKIEVIKLLKPHLAEVRITSHDASRPILKGDHILTATWDPGIPVEIAIAGFIDLDGDRFNDRARLETIIRMNGGKVVAKYDNDGEITGKMSPSTRFFVMGKPPTEIEGEGNEAAINAAWIELNTQADRFHVQKIPLNKFLNSMGYHGSASVERMDSSIGSRVKEQIQERNTDR